MALPRRNLLLGFVIALSFGAAVYFRLWAIDSSFTIDDRAELRRQFDRASMEAMDESASWRMKYDMEFDKGRLVQDELMKAKAALASANERLVALRKENASLHKQLEHCNCKNSSALLQ